MNGAGSANPKSEPMPREIAVARIRTLAEAQGAIKIVFVSGNFNVVHPGHLRLLNFAAGCGDLLVVAVNSDDQGVALLAAEHRLEAVSSIGIVDFSFVLDESPAEFIQALKPNVVVKGKEYENEGNEEQSAVDEYGGTLLFSSGEVRFSSLDLLQRELLESDLSTIRKPLDYPERHGFRIHDLCDLVDSFSQLRVKVIGDLIVDEYVNCEALGMSREDPTLVVTPIKTDRFVGGAGIVAAHACGLGADVEFFSVAGDDEAHEYAAATLADYGVLTRIMCDPSRPTTLKKRIRAEGKTLLRISELSQHDISRDLSTKLMEDFTASLDDADLVVFSDFNYGCLPQALVQAATRACLDRCIFMAADSQSSSQLGDVSRFRHMGLLTPTEHEARLAVSDQASGLVVLAERLRRKAKSNQLLLTLGSEGLLVHGRDFGQESHETDRLPALNATVRDPSGAGDSLLICSALGLAAGAGIWRSAYLGAIAAALQVGRVGNLPLSSAELVAELRL